MFGMNLMTAFLAALFVVLPASEATGLTCEPQFVDCSSHGFTQDVCPINAEPGCIVAGGSVKIKYSISDCIEHESFWIYSDNIVVHHGCRAKFEIVFQEGYSMGICECKGDPHCTTFDGVYWHYQGDCEYLMTRDDCREFYDANGGPSPTFEVYSRFWNRNGASDRVTWVKTVTIVLDNPVNTNITLDQGPELIVNGVTRLVPYPTTGNLPYYVYKYGRFMHLRHRFKTATQTVSDTPGRKTKNQWPNCPWATLQKLAACTLSIQVCSHNVMNVKDLTWRDMNRGFNCHVLIAAPKFGGGESSEADCWGCGSVIILAAVSYRYLNALHVVVVESLGLIVEFDGYRHLRIKLSSQYTDKTCGLCGIFNDDTADDFTQGPACANGNLPLPGTVATNPEDFANSWATTDECCDTTAPPECSGADLAAAKAVCEDIYVYPYAVGFEDCMNSMTAEQIAFELANCILDICNNDPKCAVVLDIFASCCALGVPVVWGNIFEECAPQCGPNQYFSACNTPTIITCVHYLQGTISEPDEDALISAGCFCEANYYLDGSGNCVSSDICGCLDGEEYLETGDERIDNPCSTKKVCIDNEMEVVNTNCDPDALCADNDYTVVCWCPENMIDNNNDGTNCTDPCDGVDCNNGVCVNCMPESCPGNYYCDCDFGYTGDNCDEDVYSLCLCKGDPHCITFDNKLFHYQGSCEYLMATDDCGDNVIWNFKIYADFWHRGRQSTHVSWVKSLQIVLNIDGNIWIIDLVQGNNLPLPAVPPSCTIIKTKRNVILTCDGMGLKVIWNGDRTVKVELKASEYVNDTCGLCGVLNGYKPDDFTMGPACASTEGAITTDQNEFGDSWETSGSLECCGTVPPPPCTDTAIIDECGNVFYSSNNVFSECLSSFDAFTVQFENDACVEDICLGGDVLCDIIISLVETCCDNGFLIEDWGQWNYCKPVCGVNMNLEINEPTYAQTCFEFLYGMISDPILCTVNCYCLEGYYYDETTDTCVLDCGCLYTMPDGTVVVVSDGTVIITDPCVTYTVCDANSWVPYNPNCDDDVTCEVVGDVFTWECPENTILVIKKNVAGMELASLVSDLILIASFPLTVCVNTVILDMSASQIRVLDKHVVDMGHVWPMMIVPSPVFVKTADPCSGNNCDVTQVCVPHVTANCEPSFTCGCETDPCSGQTCSGHGTCVANADCSFTCDCEDCWFGDYCEIGVFTLYKHDIVLQGSCTGHTCSEHGTCVPHDCFFICDCDDCWYGDDCELEMCTPGQYSEDGTCEICPGGTYQDECGQTTCKPCPDGETSFPGSDSIEDCFNCADKYGGKWKTLNVTISPSCYFFCGKEKNFAKAEARCEKKGGKMVTIETQAEDNMIYEEIKDGDHHWTGLQIIHEPPPPIFYWYAYPDREVTYLNIMFRYDNHGSDEACVQIRADTGHWMDVPCRKAYKCICEIPMEAP
ncbi:hypothetical protein ScPMuIL_002141, partial [Solemya velum]